MPAEVPRKDAGPSKRAGKDDEKHDVESEGKYELHISNISLKATESELRKLCESHGETYRVKLLRRGTMQKAFVDMENERVALKCIEALDGYDLHEQTLEVKFSDAISSMPFTWRSFSLIRMLYTCREKREDPARAKRRLCGCWGRLQPQRLMAGVARSRSLPRDPSPSG